MLRTCTHLILPVLKQSVAEPRLSHYLDRVGIFMINQDSGAIGNVGWLKHRRKPVGSKFFHIKSSQTDKRKQKRDYNCGQQRQKAADNAKNAPGVLRETVSSVIFSRDRRNRKQRSSSKKRKLTSYTENQR
jgi:hypothetical protein